MPRPLVLLLLSSLFGGLSLLIHEPDELRTLQQEAARTQAMIDRHSAQLQELAEEQLRSLQALGPREWMRTHVPSLEQERIGTGTVVFGLHGDSLVCWSGQPPFKPSRLNAQRSSLRVGNTIHLHASATGSGIHVHALRPVWVAPPLENRYLQSGFHPSLRMTKGAAVAEGGHLGPEIRDAAGEIMFRLAWRDGALETGSWIWSRLILLIMTTILLIMAIWSLCRQLVLGGAVWMGILLFLLVILGARWWSLSIPPVAPFDRFPLFDPALYATSFLFPSLGDLLINAVLLSIVVLFFRMAMVVSGRGIGAIGANLFAWIVIIALSKWTTDVIIGLVEDSSVDLDLYHVQGLSSSSVIALISMAILFGSWSILAITLIQRMLMRTARERVAATGVLAVVAGVVLLLADERQGVLPWLWPLPLLALLLLPHRQQRPGFMQLVLGLIVISFFSAYILTHYTAQREKRERQVLAERLATREDPVVELLFQEIAPRLRTDRSVYNMLNTGRGCSTSDLDALVRQRFFGGYWERYDVRLFAFGTDGRVKCATDPEPPRSFRIERDLFTDPRAAADMPDLVMEELPGQGNFYHARVAVMPADTLAPAQILVELYPRPLSQGVGFPDLLLAGEDPLGRRAGRYIHARYEQGQLVEYSGGYAFPLRWERQLDMQGRSWYSEGGSGFLATGTMEGTIFVLGLPRPTALDQLTTFSYLFTFFTLLLALASGIRAIIITRSMPAFGIGSKVRILLVLFAITSLLFFGIGTSRLLDVQYMQRAENAILEKAHSVHNELQHRLDGEPELSTQHVPYLDHLLGRISNVFFTDITLYSNSGRMLATSRPQMFTSGLLGRRMDPMAYTELVLNGRSAFVHEESVGSAVFRSAYMPLRDRQGRVMAHLSLPSFADQRQQEEERSGVLVAVVNLFVLLFAMSVLVAVFISNWTLRPLDKLKRALSAVALRGANEPIRYRGEDEVGQLVQVYNQKVAELHESAERLAQSERESAWREMARQVAHEIKNPLTPMKLGIQQFQRSWDPDAPDAKARLERFSNAMVEQIDTLSGVASAFSQFAQMPAARPQELDLHEVVRNAVDLFRASARMTIVRQDADALVVKADREHLLRVFNNLLKNALQAMDEEREAAIEVVLRSAKGEAIVEVRDNGQGIPMEARERIFTPSFTTKSSGMGLGLAMVKRIVESAGGRVWFTSVEGEGTSFFVALPLQGVAGERH